MKFKLWEFELTFDKDDAKIAVPLVLFGAALWMSTLDSLWILGGAAIYYVAFFFGADVVKAVQRHLAKWKMRCPNCRNRKIILQGYQGYKSDEQYPYYFCDECKTTAILTDGGLMKI